MATGLRRRLLTASLVIALILSSVYVASALSTLSSSIPIVRFARPIGAQREQPLGTLSLDVLLGIKETFYGANSLPTYFKPIAGENMSVSLSNSPETTPLVLRTNSTGLIRAELPVSNYYVGSIKDSRFHVSISFSILAGMTTSVVLKAVRLASPVLFDERYSALPGANVTEQGIFVKIRQTADFSNSSLAIFLERSGVNTKNFVDPNTNGSVAQTPVKILSESNGSGGLWLKLLSQQQTGYAEEPSQLSLVTYIPVYTESVGSR